VKNRQYVRASFNIRKDILDEFRKLVARAEISNVSLGRGEQYKAKLRAERKLKAEGQTRA